MVDLPVRRMSPDIRLGMFEWKTRVLPSLSLSSKSVGFTDKHLAPFHSSGTCSAY